MRSYFDLLDLVRATNPSDFVVLAVIWIGKNKNERWRFRIYDQVLSFFCSLLRLMWPSLLSGERMALPNRGASAFLPNFYS
jgi:hypothetical protein